MKRICCAISCFVMLCMLSVKAHAEDPYGVLQDAVHDHTYAMDFLLNGTPLRYAVSKDISMEEKKIFAQSLRQWPLEVLNLIEQNQRTQEFKDIIPLLKRNLTLVEQNPFDNYWYVCKASEDGAGGFLAHDRRHKNRSSICFNESIRSADRQLNKIHLGTALLHEAGHYFGLADQYGPDNAAPGYSTGPHKGSAMDLLIGNSLEERHISCDDADGFINFLDLRLYQRDGKFSPRAQRGWKSLCASSSMRYQNAQPVVLTEPDMQFLDNNLLPLFRIGAHDKQKRDPYTNWLMQVHSDTGWGNLCSPKRRRATLDFSINYTTQELQIFCNRRGTAQETPTYHFPLPYAKTWGFAMSKDQQTTQVNFEDFQLKRVSVTYRTHSRNGLISIEWDKTFKKGNYELRITMGSNLYTYMVSPNGLYAIRENNIQDKQCSLTPSYHATFQYLKKTLETQLVLLRNYEKNFYQPMLQDRELRYIVPQVNHQIRQKGL